MSVNKISVVVPCYNEEANIPRFTNELILPLSSLGPDIEYIFVDDGSTDQTASLLKSLCAQLPQAVYAPHFKNEGLGMTVRTGIERATGDAILTMDADLTFHPREARKLLAALGPGIDCVMGSPWLGGMSGVPLYRRILSHGVNLIYRILLGRPVTAASSLFRLYRSHAVKPMKLESRSFDINAEILIKLVQSGAKTVEVPVVLTTRIGGVSKISTKREIRNHIRLFKKLLRWRFKKKES